MERWRIPVALLGIVVALWAISMPFREGESQQSSTEQALTPEQQAEGYGDYEPIKAKNGAVSWDIFAATKEIERQEPDGKGYTNYWLEPAFGKEIRKLDGKTVKLMGYMFPLDSSDKQSKFLFGPYPPSCAFHYHVNANQVVEVAAAEPILFSWEPVTIEGTLTLVEKDAYSVFYRLKQARLSK